MLFYRFFISLLLVSLIPVGANIYQLWQSQTTTRATVNSELINNAKLIVNEVNNWVNLNIKSSQLIAKTSEIQSMAAEDQVPILQATDATFDWSYAAFTTDLEGNAIARSDGKPLKFYGDREYVQSILSGNDVGQQVLISRVNDKPALCLSIPIDKGQSLVGTLVQCSSLVSISNTVASAKFGETGIARLIDNKQRLIAHGDLTQLTEELRDLSADSIANLENSVEPVVSDVDGKKIVSYSIATDLGWELTVLQDYNDAYAELIASNRNALIAGIVLILGIILAAYLLGNNISKPINKLAEVASTFSKGNIRQNIPGTRRNDEIGELAKAIERLGLGIGVILRRYQQQKKQND